MTTEVSQAPLKSQQRFSLLKQSCVPKLPHELDLGTTHRNTLKRLDVQIRQMLRTRLKLSTVTPPSFLYAKIRDEDVGVPYLKTLVPSVNRRRLDNVLSSKEPVVRTADTIPSVFSSMRLAAEAARVGCKVLASKKTVKDIGETPFTIPRRVAPVVISPNLPGLITGSPTLIECFPGCSIEVSNLSRVSSQPKLAGIEGYVLGICCVEVNDGTLCKHDCILLNNSSATAIDVAVAGEDCTESLYTGKIECYSAAEIEANLRQIPTKPTDFPITHMPAVFAARGSVYLRTERNLRILGLSKFEISDLSLAEIRGSL
ncbi:unnamed protein product [Dibothriocephalus latus]|uniref:Uncharacterized protein n=1 Tax=Dibothriocephalus latus TaxID=60516 RepID=A0A3P7P1R9_DIBLA|nr:unnamed protein product [Dibothriocephalus latus]